jgi:4-amino-4-deoxy-L-arabinose transferase-like glycosyltransferase
VTARAGRAIGGAVASFAIAVAIYTSGLDTSPPYLMHDELQFSLQARSIAETGRDLSGRRLPLYFTEPEFPAGRDPVAIYTTAAGLQVLPFSEYGAKLPTALIGVLNIALMAVAGQVLFGNIWFGLLAGVLLALTPIHFIRSRLVLSPIYSIPFILGWLIALAAYLRTGSRRSLLASVALVTASVYSYLACIFMAPIYFAIALVLAVRREGRVVIGPMILTAAIVLAPLVLWSIAHPERYGQLIDAYRLYGSTGPSPMVPVLPDQPTGPRLWLGLAWQVFSPDFLFVSGDASMVNSTRQAGLFPIAFAILIPAGVWASIRPPSPLGFGAAGSTKVLERIIVIGLFTAPLASIASGSIQMNRLMFLIPFGVLAALIGAIRLVTGRTLARAIGIALLISVPIQFASFHRQYLNEYPAHAAPWFGGNVREVVRTVAASRGEALLSARIPFVHRYWSFYAPEDRRNTAGYFSDAVPEASAGARAACPARDAACARLEQDGRWQLVASIKERSGEESFQVFERQ